MGKPEISKFKRIINKFRYGLIFQVIRNMLAKVGIEITPYYWIQEGVGFTEVPEIKGVISEYTVDFLDQKDMKILGETARGYTENALLSSLNEGNLCFGLRHMDLIAAFMWIHLNECSYEPHKFQLNKDKVYLQNFLTM